MLKYTMRPLHCPEVRGQTVIEDERSRLARELHDDFNQRLAVLTVDLERTTSVFEIRSRPKQGTTIEVWVPLNPVDRRC